MDIHERIVTIGELVDGFVDSDEAGVTGYGGLLDVRPAYQREYVYSDKQQKAVIDTVRRGLPLNTMYWATTADGRFEVLDGQQRTISVARYVAGDFSDDDVRYFGNLTSDEKADFLGYQLRIYVCDGTESERLAWFQRINVAGVQLTEQELRNAVYTGPWLADAKRFFSKPTGGAAVAAQGLVKGSPIRQELLQTALEWIVAAQGLSSVEQYMGQHQHAPNASELKLYFRNVTDWAREFFPVVRREQNGLPWGLLYNDHHDRTDLDADELEARVKTLMADDEVTAKRGIYGYVLTGDEKHLSLRSFNDRQKREMYERQNGLCARPHLTGHDAQRIFALADMEADHIDPWSAGGKTEVGNGQMLCRQCNRRKSAA